MVPHLAVGNIKEDPIEFGLDTTQYNRLGGGNANWISIGTKYGRQKW